MNKLALVLGILSAISGLLVACNATPEDLRATGELIDQTAGQLQRTHDAITGEQTGTDWTNVGIGSAFTLLGTLGISLWRLLRGERTQTEKENEVIHARIDKTKGEVDELWERTHRSTTGGGA